MNFLDYIQGKRKGEDAHRIEKDSMNDPFLYEAIEGFDNVKDDHIKRIGNIQSRLRTKTKKKPAQSHFWQIAATVAILIFGLAGYLFIDYHRADLYAQENNYKIIEIYVPDAFYEENITVVAKKNEDLAKAYNINISRFKAEGKPSEVMSNEEFDILSTEKTTPIDIYIPESFDSDATPMQSANNRPEPVIGFEKYDEYLKKSMRRPTDGACRDRKGKVVIDFYVNDSGEPCLFEIVQSICGTSDSEAVRLIQSGPKWTLGSEKVRVRVEF